ncbi:MAG TPA: DNRLRE domain-containing protein, partial [Planctomycetota bacterium]|nr:DNRLRE domain-containing protein [Planctomycetota bacterium]
MRFQTLARSNLMAALIIGAIFLAGPLHAVSVGDPEIKTDDTYFPGELALSTLPRIVAHAYSIPRGTVGSSTEHDKLIKLFLWRCEHFTHLESPELIENPNYTPDPAADNTLITEYDTLRGMFSYAWGVCGTNHAQFRAICDEAGLGHRRRGLPGDTGQEVYENGGWRYVNTDQYTLHFLSNSLSADFASLDQVVNGAAQGHYIEWNPDLGGSYFMPQANTHGSYATFAGVTGNIPFRSLQWRSYYNGVWNASDPSWDPTFIMYAEGYACQPIVYRLKRGESFTRWLHSDGIVTDLGLAGKCWWGYNSGTAPHAGWTFAQNAPARDQTSSGSEESSKTGGMDYGNGCFDWQPSLANSEHLDGVVDQTGTFVVGGLPMLKATTAGTLVFEVNTPYTICGRPTQNNSSGHIDPAFVCVDGAMLYTTSSGTITVDVSNDMGATWTSKGNLAATLDLTEQVKARNAYLVRLNFSTNAGLNSLRLRTITMVATAVYPTLKSGTTTVTYAAGNCGTIDYSPSLMTAAGAASTTGYTTKVADSGVTYAGYSGSSFAYSQSINAPATITYKIVIPPSLAAAGATFKQIFAAENTSVHVTPNPGASGQIDISTSASGPWTQIGHFDIPNDNVFSSFWTYGRSPDATSLGGTTYYVRFIENNAGSSSQNFRYLRINATYNLPTPTTPMDVTYFWNNGSAQNSTHTIPAGTTNTSWSISTGTIASQSKVVFSVPSGGAAGPVITTQPSNQTVIAPATATFTVVASGPGLTYQWKKGGAPITGATSASYTTPATTTADSGSQFTVDVTNAGGTVTSNVATLTVNTAGAPVITSQPANQSVTEPATATFSVTATGATSYQWKRNGVDIGGATSASYTTGATSVGADNGVLFTVAVTNANGTVLSNTATLTVTAASSSTTVTFQQGTASYTGTVDTYLDAIAPNDTSSFGTQQRVDVNYFNSGTTENTIALFKFDTSSIPAGATVTAAQVDLWLTRTNSVDGSDQLVLGKVTSSWDNNSTYAGGVPSSTSSGVTPPSLAAIPNNNTLSPEVQYSIPGMAALVQSWVTTPGS